MKKKFKITEEQAQQIIKLSEADMPGGTTTSTTPCDQWLTTYPNGVVGDIDCCKQLAAGTLTSSSKQQCNNTWNPVGSGWQECCPTVIDDPEPCENEENCWYCKSPGNCITLSTAGYSMATAVSMGLTLYPNNTLCLASPECEDHHETKNCSCCKQIEGGSVTAYSPSTPIPMGDPCSQFDDPGNGVYGCEDQTVFDITRCEGYEPVEYRCCCEPVGVPTVGTTIGEQLSPRQDSPPQKAGEDKEIEPGTTSTDDPQTTTSTPSGQPKCKPGSELMVQLPDPCPQGYIEIPCRLDNTGGVVGPLYTENKTELSEEIKRIKQLLR